MKLILHCVKGWAGSDSSKSALPGVYLLDGGSLRAHPRGVGSGPVRLPPRRSHFSVEAVGIEPTGCAW